MVTAIKQWTWISAVPPASTIAIVTGLAGVKHVVKNLEVYFLATLTAAPLLSVAFGPIGGPYAVIWKIPLAQAGYQRAFNDGAEDGFHGGEAQEVQVVCTSGGGAVASIVNVGWV